MSFLRSNAEQSKCWPAPTTLTRGTFIRCSLETKVVSTLPGMTSCIVTEPIYSMNGSHLLIDKGSKVTGEYQYADENYDRIGIIVDPDLDHHGSGCCYRQRRYRLTGRVLAFPAEVPRSLG
ncbi:MAG: TrbI/VirB10 family protein [Burkholderiaceae bacterium]